MAPPSPPPAGVIAQPGFPVPVRSARVRVVDQLVAMLCRRGIDRVFGIPGGTISPFFDALLDSPIRVITCQHETMAVYAAAGYARATSLPGVVAVTSGPGILNAITGIAAADLDESPVLVLAGEVNTASAGRAPLQDGGPAGLDVMALVRPITRCAETVWRPEQAGPVVEHALSTISRHPRGAAFIRLPVDVAQAGASRAEVALPSLDLPAADDATCGRIARLLSEAERPAIMLGVGARNAAVGPIVLDLAHWLRCPVLTDVEAKGVFPESDPLALGIFGVGARGAATQYLADGVDVLLAIGCRFDDTTTAGYSEAVRATRSFIQLDHAAARLGRSYAADVMVHADLAATLRAIHRACPMPAMETLFARDRLARRPGIRSPAPPKMDAPPFDPRAVVLALQQTFGPDTLFVCDIGNHMLFAAATMVLDAPDRFFVSLGLGGMSSGIGHAVGWQHAVGRARRVVCVCGDGGLWMAGNELLTCAAERIPLTVALFNDGQLGMVRHGIERLFGRTAEWSCTGEVADYGHGLGAVVVRVDSFADLRRAAESRPDRPMVLDIPIDREVRAVNAREANCRVAAPELA